MDLFLRATGRISFVASPSDIAPKESSSAPNSSTKLNSAPAGCAASSLDQQPRHIPCPGPSWMSRWRHPTISSCLLPRPRRDASRISPQGFESRRCSVARLEGEKTGLPHRCLRLAFLRRISLRLALRLVSLGLGKTSRTSSGSSLDLSPALRTPGPKRADRLSLPGRLSLRNLLPVSGRL